MKYQGFYSFNHKQTEKIGVLLVNLGTPAAPTAKALKPYLKQFLSDPRVVEIPRLIWWCILHLIILRIRPKRSAEAYASVWTDEGSPLEVHTRRQARLLQDRYAGRHGKQILVDWAMRYGSPSITEKVQAFQEKGVRKLVVLPLYPQYSGATTGSTFDALAEDFTQRRWLPDLRFVSCYHDFSLYIEALAGSIEEHWQTHGRAERLVMSYHGVPLRYLHQGDPYHCHCLKTSRLLAERLGLSSDEYITTFQSRFGKAEWLKPYTDATMKALPGQGVKSVQVVCPGFAADCLETIEEIGDENKGYFLAAGGERFEYIPALNTRDEHIFALEKLVDQQLAGWNLQSVCLDEVEARAERASEHAFNQRGST